MKTKLFLLLLCGGVACAETLTTSGNHTVRSNFAAKGSAAIGHSTATGADSLSVGLSYTPGLRSATFGYESFTYGTNSATFGSANYNYSETASLVTGDQNILTNSSYSFMAGRYLFMDSGLESVVLGNRASSTANRTFLWSGELVTRKTNSTAGSFQINAPGGINLWGGVVSGNFSGATNIDGATSLTSNSWYLATNSTAATPGLTNNQTTAVQLSNSLAIVGTTFTPVTGSDGSSMVLSNTDAGNAIAQGGYFLQSGLGLSAVYTNAKANGYKLLFSGGIWIVSDGTIPYLDGAAYYNSTNIIGLYTRTLNGDINDYPPPTFTVTSNANTVASLVVSGARLVMDGSGVTGVVAQSVGPVLIENIVTGDTILTNNYTEPVTIQAAITAPSIGSGANTFSIGAGTGNNTGLLFDDVAGRIIGSHPLTVDGGSITNINPTNIAAGTLTLSSVTTTNLYATTITGGGGGLTNVVNATATNTLLSLGKNVVYLRDEFIGGAANDAGDLRWSTVNSPTLQRYPDATRWGVRRMVSLTTSNTAYQSTLGVASINGAGLPTLANKWQSTFIFQPFNSNAVSHVIGFAQFQNLAWNNYSPRGAVLRYDDLLGDTNWVLVCATSGAGTTNYEFAAAHPGGLNTNWQTIVFESFTPGEITVSIDGSTRMTNTYYTDVAPIVAIVPRDGSNTKSNQLDYFDFTAYPTR